MHGLDMANAGGTIPLAVTLTGAALGVVGGAVASNPPDAATGAAGLYVGVGGILMGAATLLGVLSDKFMPHYINLAQMRAQNNEEFRKNREARHRMANDLQRAEARMAIMEEELAAAKRLANESENLAIEARTKLEVVEQRVGRVQAVAEANTDRIQAVETFTGVGSGDTLPVAPPAVAGPGPEPPR